MNSEFQSSWNFQQCNWIELNCCLLFSFERLLKKEGRRSETVTVPTMIILQFYKCVVSTQQRKNNNKNHENDDDGDEWNKSGHITNGRMSRLSVQTNKRIKCTGICEMFVKYECTTDLFALELEIVHRTRMLARLNERCMCVYACILYIPAPVNHL